MFRKSTTFAFVITLICLLGYSSVDAQTFTADRKQTLRGLNAFLMVVEFTQDAVEMDGLSRTEMELDVAERLRSAGIRLMNETEWSRTEGVPYLIVYLNTVRSELGFYSYRAEVKLNQEVIMKRNRSLSHMSSTWETGSLGLIGIDRIASIRSEIMELVDIFIADWQAVNIN